MKIKTILIAVGVTAGCAGGIGFGAKVLMERSIAPVQVAPVANVLVDTSYFMDDTSISGNVVSADTQNIELLQEEGVFLKEIFVSPGDEVKTGDKLLEYDMTLIELQRELEDLTHQVLELELQKAEKSLEELIRNPGGASAFAQYDDEDEDDLTQSADEVMIDDDLSGISEDNEDPGFDPEDDLFSDDDPYDDVYDDPYDDPDDDSYDDSYSGEDDPFLIDDDLEPQTDVSGSGETSDDGSGQRETSPVENMIDVRDPERASEGEITSEQEDINDDALEFIRRVNAMNSSGMTPDLVSADYMSQTFAMFEQSLAQLSPESNDETIHYVLQNKVTEAIYAKSSAYSTDTFDYPTAMQVSLFRAYGNLCLFRLQRQMGALEKALAGTNMQDPDAVTALKPQITDAADAYRKLKGILPGLENELTKLGEDESVQALTEIYKSHLALYGGENLKLEDTESGSLSRILRWLTSSEEAAAEELIPFVEDPEAATESLTEDMEPFTEFDFDDDEFDDGDYDEPAYTQEELEEMIRDAKAEIDEYKLQIRESDLKLKHLDRLLEKRVVTASMDGIVKSSGGEDDYAEQYALVISGQAGMYVHGSLNELSRDSVKVGDTLTVTSYDTEKTYQAKITQISEYPTTGEDEYSGWGTENPNASYYPFTAYIDTADDLEDGYVEMKFDNQKDDTGGMYLDKTMIRTDKQGKDYVMIQGEDGLLKKQVIRTGKTLWNSYVQIVSGLSQQDLIAIPYGKNVEEGAKTVEVESFDY